MRLTTSDLPGQRNDAVHVVVNAATHQGLKRRQNEDRHAVWIPETEAERGRRGVLMLVADGMGGARAGEVASSIVAERVPQIYRESATSDPSEALRQAIATANAAVHEESRARPERGGMGTTCTTVVVREGEVFLAHVGDSRAYLVRGRSIRQLTQDHSLVAQLVRDRQITESQAKIDPRRNVVTRSVGVGANLEVDAMRVDEPLSPGDTLVVCSDGLHGVVDDDEIATLASRDPLDDACKALIARANERGGPDNITVILARIVPT